MMKRLLQKLVLTDRRSGNGAKYKTALIPVKLLLWLKPLIASLSNCFDCRPILTDQALTLC